MRAKCLSITAALALVFAIVGCDEPSPEPPAKKEEAKPPLELRLGLDGEQSKPEEGVMIGRCELINRSSEPKEFDTPGGLLGPGQLHVEWVDPNGKKLGATCAVPWSVAPERIHTKLPPGGRIADEINLSLNLHTLHGAMSYRPLLGVYQAWLVFQYEGEEVRSNVILVNQQAPTPGPLYFDPNGDVLWKD